MELRTNCKNCGAPLHYDRNDYGRIAICEYCNTEYHIDLSGRIEEYKVKLEIMGQIKEFYIGEWSMNPLCIEGYRGIDGTYIMPKPIYKMTLKLIEI